MGKYEDTRMEQEELQKSLQWIPVEEQLPKNEHSVLVCGLQGCVNVGWYIRGIWRTGFSAAEIRKDVVAWMPLPEPYRTQENQKLGGTV